MPKKTTNLNIRVSEKLLDSFNTACNNHDDTNSHIIREMMRAFIELCARAKGRRLPRLDLCGFEETQGESKGGKPS